MSDVSQGPGWWQASDGKWYPPQPSGQTIKKPIYKKVWFWLLIVLVLIVGGCSITVFSAGKAVNQALNEKVTVVYKVTGDGTATVTYDTLSGGGNGTSQLSGQSLPWTTTVTGKGIFNVFTLTATIESGTTATCSITVNGKVVSTNTATGMFSSASCTGSPNQ